MALQSKQPVTEEAAKRRMDREVLSRIFVGENSLLSKLEKQLDTLVDTREGAELNFPKLSPMERREELRGIVKTFEEMRAQADFIADPEIREGVKVHLIDLRGEFSENSDIADLVKVQGRIAIHETGLQIDVDARMTLLPVDVLKDIEFRINGINARTNSLLGSYEKIPPKMTETLSELERDWVKPALSFIDMALRGTVNFDDPELNLKLSQAVGEIKKDLNSKEFKQMAAGLEPGLRYQIDEMSGWADWLYRMVYNDERKLDVLQDPDYWAQFAPHTA
ncbi:MAG: hypothetical protein KGH98_01170 [Candidatus Micrarchaeota archaeon]|nr:hypothetical protein [Candidatus Micrarchaeota archaeon]